MTLLTASMPKPACGNATNNVFLSKKTVCVLGAPVSFGQTLAGVGKGPAAIRAAGLSRIIESLDWECVDQGDLSVTADETVIKELCDQQKDQSPRRPIPSETYTEDELPKSVALGQACGNIFHAVRSAALRGEFVLTVGGDHSIGVSTLSGMLSAYPNLCVVWVDAHGDINVPESSPSGSYHGMPAAHVLGWFKKRAPGFEWLDTVPHLEEQRLGYIGLRDIDSAERKLINSSSVVAKTVQDIEGEGIATVVRQVLESIDPENNRPIHLTFDIDACDPSIAPGTGTRARGGLSYREAHYICQKLCATGRLVSMDLVEVNPDIDTPDEFLHGDDPRISADATKTVRLALELIASGLGCRIL